MANFSANALKIDKIGTGYTLGATDGALTSATSSAFNITLGAAAKLAFTTQTTGGTGGTAWTTQPVVTVQDAGGNTVTTDTSTVTLAIANNAGPGGVLSGTVTETAVAGVASFSGNGLNIDKKGTGYTLAATDSSLTSATSSTFNITVGAAAKLAFTTQPGGGTGGTAWTTQPVVTVQDAGGNTVTTDASAVTVAIANNVGPGGVLSGTLTKAAVAGVASFSANALKIDKIGMGYTLSATDGALTSATSSAFNITTGTAAKLAYTTVPSTGTAGTAFSVTVQSQDAGGNPASPTSTTTITLSKATGAGTLSGTLTGTIPTSGNSVIISTPVYSKSDTMTLTATATAGQTGLTAVTSGNIVFSAGAATKLAFTTQPGNGTGGSALSTQPVVTVQDANGNTVTTDTSTVTVTIGTNPGGGTLGGTLIEAAVGGVASFSGNGLNINKTGTGYTLVATDGALTSATSSTFNITVGAAAKLAFTTQPGGGTGGTAWTTQPVVTVQDAGGNTVTTDSSTVTVAILNNAGGGILSGTLTKAASSGVANFSANVLKIDKIGTGYTLTATDGALTSATSGAFNVTLGAIASYSMTATTPQTRGTAFTVTVTALDAGGNTETSDNTTVVTNTSSTGNVLFDANGDSSFNDNIKTLTAGTFTISVKDNYFESVTFSATDQTGKTGSSSSITINGLSGDYRSRITGQTWATANTWETYNGSTWATAVSAPTSSTTGQISVLNTHTVTVAASVTAQNLNIASGGTVLIANSQTLTVSNGVANGVISNGSSNNSILTEINGTFVLNGNNSYGGGTIINGGTMSVANVNDASGNQNLGNGRITFANGGTLLNTGSGAQTTAKPITLNSGGGVITMSGNTITLTGTISGGGGLTSGGSDLILTPTSANTIGTMTVNSGRLFVGNANAIANSAVLHINGGTLDFQYAAGTPANTMTFASGSCLANRSGSTITASTGNITFPTAGTIIFNNDDLVSSPITVSGAYPALTGALTIQVGGNNLSVGTVTLSGSISGSGSLTKTSTGTLILGTANSYTGGTTVSGGFLTANVTGSLGSGALSIASGATNTLANGTTETVAALYLNGVRQVAGTWGGTASTASNKNGTYFGTTATGILTAGGITVTAQANTKTYDGTTSAAAVPTITAGALAAGDTATLAETYNNNNQGTAKTLTPTAVITDAGSNNVTSFYTITYVNNTAGVINAAASTTAASAASATYSGSGQSVTLNATVTSAAGTVNEGTVTFTLFQGIAQVGTPTISGTVSGGAASVNYVLPAGQAAGTYAIRAVYNPAVNFATSSDNTHSLTISTATSTTTASAASATYNGSAQNVTLNATITSAAGTVNQGTVTFTIKNGATVIGTATTSGTVSSGAASVSYALPAGQAAAAYTIQAAYNSAGNFATSTDSTHSLTINKASPTFTLSSSENPSGYRDSVSFTAGLPTNATGSVVFTSTNGPISTNALTSGSATSLSVTNLPRGTNSVTVQYAGDSNYLAFTNLLAGGQIVTNHPPVITGSVTFTRSANAIKIFTSNLITNATDVDGDTLAVTSSSVSTNGITLQTAPGILLYVNTNGVNDAFTYTVSDGYGGSATGTNYVNFAPFATGQSGSVTVGGGVVNLVFYGIPTYRYGVQRSTNMSDWTIILITNAPTGGAFHYTDNFSDLSAPPASAYYRLIWNP